MVVKIVLNMQKSFIHIVRQLNSLCFILYFMMFLLYYVCSYACLYQ